MQKRSGIQCNLDKERDRRRIKDNGKRQYQRKKLLIKPCRSIKLMEIKFESCVEQAVIMGHAYALWMPTISNTIRQMDQSAAGLDHSKSSWSREEWISVSPTERGRRLRCMSPHASWSLPFEWVSLSLSLSISPHPPVCRSYIMIIFTTVSPKNWITRDRREAPC